MSIFNGRSVWNHYEKLLSDQRVRCKIDDEQIIYQSTGSLDRHFDIIVPDGADLSGFADHKVLILGGVDIQSTNLNHLPGKIECSHNLNIDIIEPIQHTTIRFFCGGTLYGLLLTKNIGDLCVEDAHTVKIKTLRSPLERDILKGLVLKNVPCLQIMYNSSAQNQILSHIDPEFLGIEYDNSLRNITLTTKCLTPESSIIRVWERPGNSK